MENGVKVSIIDPNSANASKTLDGYGEMPVLVSQQSFEVDVPSNLFQVIDSRSFTFVAYPIGGDRLFVMPATQNLLNALSDNAAMFRILIDNHYYNVAVNRDSVFGPDGDILKIVNVQGDLALVKMDHGGLYDHPDRLLNVMSNSVTQNEFNKIKPQITVAEIKKEQERLLGHRPGQYIKNELEAIKAALGNDVLFEHLILNGPAPPAK
jgi:hypothetical protein